MTHHVNNRARRRIGADVGGHALAETLIALLALAPFVAGVVLLGKQVDIKHKAFDATRYSVWERTVWRSGGVHNTKTPEQVTLESRDRILGDPRAGLMHVDSLANEGITENPLWRDLDRERLLSYEDNVAALRMDSDERASPVDVGYVLIPSIAHGDGLLADAGQLLQVRDLDLTRRSFATSQLQVAVRPILSMKADRLRTLSAETAEQQSHAPIVQQSRGALLSDTWSALDERDFRRRVDWLTTDEFIETLELPARPIGSMALGKGELLYGEGQFAWDPTLEPTSTTLPQPYVTRR
jgi:hypothetical protein